VKKLVEFNLIEKVFAILKKDYRHLRTQAIASNVDVAARTLVMQAVNNLKRGAVQSLCASAIKDWLDPNCWEENQL
jgi:hypothetical protein